MIVYTAVFGGHDTLKPLPKGIKGVCFTDAESVPSGWEKRQEVYHDSDPRLRARHHKMMPHKLFPGETTVWMDGSIVLNALPEASEFRAFAHKERVPDTYGEIKACIKHKKISPAQAEQCKIWLEEWKKEGFLDNGGHPETGVLVREDTEKIRSFNEAWWGWIQKCPRDQIYCDYLRWKFGLKWTRLPGAIHTSPLVTFSQHVKNKDIPLQKIWYFTPYDAKGLGVAYNKCCKIVPDDGWVCVMDADVMLFPSHFGNIVQETIAKDQGVDVWTTMTTRINCNESTVCPGGKRDTETDLVRLHAKARGRAQDHAGSFKRLDTPWLGGYFMLFRKSLWREFPFPEVINKPGLGAMRGCTVLGIDTTWSNQLHKAGKVFGVIEGLLAVHYYSLHGSRHLHFKELEHPPVSGEPVSSGITRPPADRKRLIRKEG